MREIITIQVGHTGNKIGQKFWQVIGTEHGIIPNGEFRGQSGLQLERVPVYFNETSAGRFVPRVIMADLDCSTSKSIVDSSPESWFDSDRVVCGELSGSNNYGKGYYSEGVAVADSVFDLVEQDIDKCDHLHGFQIIHSASGGAGSGLGCRIMDGIREMYPDKIVKTLTVFPSPQVSDVVVEPYNTCLAIRHLIDSSDEAFVFDNQALSSICAKRLRLKNSTIPDLNHLITLVMSGLTAGFRFPGQLNTDLRKLAVNMVPFKNLHFFIPAFAPLVSIHEKAYRSLGVHELVAEMFSPGSLMLSCHPDLHRYITCSGIFRGRLSTHEIMNQVALQKKRHASLFIPGIPNNCKVAVCDIPPCGFNMAATFVVNTTAVHRLFERCLKQFGHMFRKKAFLHWYTNEGMDEQEFVESEDATVGIIKAYADLENTTEVSDNDDEESW